MKTVANKKRISYILAFALCVVMALSVAACGSSGNSGSSAPAPAPAPAEDGSEATAPAGADISGILTLNMMTTYQPGMQAVIDDFLAANPNVTFEADFVTDIVARRTQLPAQFAGGAAPDLVHLVGGSASVISLGVFNDAGYLTDLNDQPWIANMYPLTKDRYTFDGKTVAIDFGYGPVADIIYDKAYFSENSLEIPTTYAELVALCTEIKALGKTPISFAGGEGTVNSNNLAAMAASSAFAKNPNWLKDRLEGKITFADPENGWKVAVTQLKELIDMGAFAPGAAAMTQTDMIADFASGNTAMMFGYSGLAGLILKENPDLDLSQFCYPGVTAADTHVALNTAGGVAITTQSQNLDAAYAFLDFMALPEEAAKMADLCGVISPAQAQSGELSGTYVDLGPLFKANQIILDPTTAWPNTNFTPDVGSSVQGLFTGQKTVDQVLADMDKAFDVKPA